MRRGLAEQLKPPYYWWAVEGIIARRMQRKHGYVDRDWIRRRVEILHERFEMRIAAAIMV